MEFMLHFMYVVAIAKAHAWQGDSPVQLGMIAYFNLKLIWLKLLIIWRFFRFWAMADGFQVDENMLRCASNVYSMRSFWRMWHRSYNRWTIRYNIMHIYTQLSTKNRSLPTKFFIKVHLYPAWRHQVRNVQHMGSIHICCTMA